MGPNSTAVPAVGDRPSFPTNPAQYGQPIYQNGGRSTRYDNYPQQPSHRPPPRFQYHPPQFYIPREDPVQKKQRRCLYTYYVLRQAAIIITFILIILNINIYVSRRGKYLNDTTSAADPVYYTMWLTIPLAGVVAIWGVIGLLCIRRSSHKGGMPYQMQFGVELLFALAAMVCFVLLVVNIASKQASEEDYYYPYFRYEVPLAGLLIALVFVQCGLVARAWFEFSLERKHHEGEMVQV